MAGKGQNVDIWLQSTIDDSGEREVNTFQQVGKFYNRDNFDVLIYEEINEDGEQVKNFITIQSDKVNIKRSGFVSMNQLFELNRKTEAYYKHPYGNILMETYTHSIDYHSLQLHEQGKLTIQYTVTLNSTMKRKQLLELTYQEEGST